MHLVSSAVSRPPRKDLILTIQGTVASVLGNQHRGQLSRGRDPLVDGVRGHGRLDQGFAVLAHPLTLDMPLNREYGWCVVQLLADIFVDTHAYVATLTYDAARTVVHLRRSVYAAYRGVMRERWFATRRAWPRRSAKGITGSGDNAVSPQQDYPYSCTRICMDLFVPH